MYVRGLGVFRGRLTVGASCFVIVGCENVGHCCILALRDVDLRCLMYSCLVWHLCRCRVLVGKGIVLL